MIAYGKLIAKLFGNGSGEELADWLEQNGLTESQSSTVVKLLRKVPESDNNRWEVTTTDTDGHTSSYVITAKSKSAALELATSLYIGHTIIALKPYHG